jgi:nucleotide-binding universal stress UspA family protein
MPSLRRIVATADFSAFSERGVQRAVQLAKQHQAELHVLHVVRPLDLYPGMTFPPAAICQCIVDSHADLVVLGRHGHGGGLQDWLLGSVSKDVALAADCDVLLIGPGGR